jgi:hypothetical protein
MDRGAFCRGSADSEHTALPYHTTSAACIVPVLFIGGESRWLDPDLVVLCAAALD